MTASSLIAMAVACGSTVTIVREGAGGSSSAIATYGVAVTTGTSASCGNAIVESGEQCDDGNANDEDGCRNNCTTGPMKAVCGNGVIEGVEECDDGNASDDDGCRNNCKTPKCGDGVVQKGEDCDDGNTISGDKCPGNCKCKPKTFAGVVSNENNPKAPRLGLYSKWIFLGMEGVKAGNAMCLAIGADRICKHSDIVAADAAGELASLPTNVTYWLHRTTPVMDPTQPNKSCKPIFDAAKNSDDYVGNTKDCSTGVSKYCDPNTLQCSIRAGAGGRCNEWTFPSNHVADGEWFEVYNPASSFNAGGFKEGTLSFHYDGDTTYTGQYPSPTCKSLTTPGCAGPCGGAQRAILCCFDSCT